MTVCVGSTICLSPASVGIQCSPAFSRSAPVMTARTPGILSASEASMHLILAWAYGLRTMSSHSMPGSTTSSMYSPAPRMNRGSSLRLTEWPMPPTSGVVRSWLSVVMSRSPAQPPRPSPRLPGLRSGGHDRGRLGLAQLAGRLLDRLDDVHVAGAAAEVAADALADLPLVGSGFWSSSQAACMIIPGVQKPHWRPCWSQNACWSGWRVAPVGHALDGGDLAAVGLDGEHRARLGALPVDVDGARAAVAGVAADVRAGQPEVVAQEVDQQQAGLDVGLACLAVDGDA